MPCKGLGLWLVDVVAEVGATGEVHGLNDIGVDDSDCRLRHAVSPAPGEPTEYSSNSPTAS